MPRQPSRLIFIGDSTLQEIVLELVSFLLSATPDEFPNADRSHVHAVFDFGADWAVEDCLELSLGRVQHTKSSAAPRALSVRICPRLQAMPRHTAAPRWHTISHSRCSLVPTRRSQAITKGSHWRPTKGGFEPSAGWQTDMSHLPTMPFKCDKQ